MKSSLITLVVLAAGAAYVLAAPPSFTVRPIEEAVVPAPVTTTSIPAQNPTSVHPATSTPATTTRPTPTPRPTPGAVTPSTTPTPDTSGTTPAAGTSANTPAPTPQETSYALQVEELVLQKTNIERAKNDLAGLAPDSHLASIARAHSADMQSKNYFSHTDSDGCDSSCRADNAGYQWTMIGENIYMMSGYTLSPDAAAEKIVQGWMNSPGHRANILKTEYTQTGVGVVSIGKDIYATAVYAKPK